MFPSTNLGVEPDATCRTGMTERETIAWPAKTCVGIGVSGHGTVTWLL
jgi:hypothetical protein